LFTSFIQQIKYMPIDFCFIILMKLPAASSGERK
jgi:hypothetical protein